MKLYAVSLHCIKIDWRKGVPKVAMGVAVGTFAADEMDNVQKWATLAVMQQFPVTKGWQDHAYTISETPDSVLEQVRPTPVVVAEVAAQPAKRKKRKPREEWDGSEDE